MRRKGRPKKQKAAKVVKVPGKRGRPRKKEIIENEPPPKKAKRGRPRTIKIEQDAIEGIDDPLRLSGSTSQEQNTTPDDNYSEGLHMSTMQVRALSSLVACLDCGEEVVLGVRPTTKGMISEFTVSCKVCDSQKSTNTPNLIRERKRKREKKGVILQKNENINYAHVAAFLDNGLGYSGLRHYCRYFNARCLNEATFIVYAKQVIADVVAETEDFLHQNARIVRKAFESQLDTDYIVDLTVGYTTTYHQWGSDFCLVAGAVIELQTGLVLDYDVGNMYCHVCKINAKKIVSMSPMEMTDWFNKHQDTCEIREWCDEIDQDSEEGIKEIDPKYLEAFIAKKMWNRSLEKFGFRYTTLIHESDERIHSELLKAGPYGDIPVIIDNITNCFSRRKSEHARTSFQNKLKAKCPRERVQTKDRIMYVYAMSIPEYNKFAIGSNIKLRELVRRMEIEEEEYQYAAELSIQASEIIPAIQEREERAAELKEIGDAFEMEEEPEDEEGEGDEVEGQKEKQQPPQEMVTEEEEEEEEEDDDEDEEEEEEDEGEEEGPIVIKQASIQDDGTTDSKDIEDFEVLEEEEEEIEEDEMEEEEGGEINLSDKQIPNAGQVSKNTPTPPIIIRTETNKSSESVMKKTASNTGGQSVIRKETASEGKSDIDTGSKNTSFSAIEKITIVSGEKKALQSEEKSALQKKKVPVVKETQSSDAGKLSSASGSGERKIISTNPLRNVKGIEKSITSSERNVKPDETKENPSEHKKIVVMTGKKPIVSSGESKVGLPAARNASVTSIEVRKREIAEKKTPTQSATEVRRIPPPEDKVKLVVTEGSSKANRESEAAKKENQRHEPVASGSERRQEITNIEKSFSENGVEVKNRQPKQAEVIKPFRVDFDED